MPPIPPPPGASRPLALVTGGCSGIGRALADRLADRGHDLLLVSERQDRMAEAAEALRRAHGGVVHTVHLDLARPGAALELHRRVGEMGLAPDVLVSNAGFLLFGEVADTPLDRADALLQLHVVTPSLLCTLFGRDLRRRRRGRILLVSSISAWRDFPGIAYYGSSKKYLRGFARALRSELQVHGVSVTCLSPGPTDTALYAADAAPVARGKRLGLFMSADAVAEAGVRALLAGRAECVPGLRNRLMATASALTPQWVIDLLRRRAPWLRTGADAP